MDPHFQLPIEDTYKYIWKENEFKQFWMVWLFLTKINSDWTIFLLRFVSSPCNFFLCFCIVQCNSIWNMKLDIERLFKARNPWFYWSLIWIGVYRYKLIFIYSSWIRWMSKFIYKYIFIFFIFLFDLSTWFKQNENTWNEYKYLKCV